MAVAQGLFEVSFAVSADSVAGLRNGIRRGLRGIGQDANESIAQGFTAAFAVAVGAATAFEFKFEKTMLRIKTLTDTTAQQFKDFGDQINNLAKETGTGPEKLAESLYFIQSAGLAASNGISAVEKAQQVLTQTAKLSAIGLDNTAASAQTLTSAMNAYSSSGLSAKEASDTLIAALRIGKAEPEAFAASLGNVLPIASALGVSFQEVSANLAVLTQTGASAQNAATQLQAFLSAIVQLQRPSTDQSTLLRELNLDSKELLTNLKDKGLFAVLQQLEGATGGNLEQLRLLFPNIRALRDILGSSAGTGYADSLKDVQAASEGVGDTQEAFKKALESNVLTVDKIIASIKVFALELGAKTVPAIVNIANAFKPYAVLLGKVLLLTGDFIGVIGKATPIILAFGAAMATAFAVTKLTAAYNAISGLVTIIPLLASSTAIGGGATSIANALGRIIGASTGSATALGLLKTSLVNFSLSGTATTGTIGTLTRSLAGFAAANGPLIAGVAAVGVGLFAANKLWQAHKDNIIQNTKEYKSYVAALDAGKTSREAVAQSLTDEIKLLRERGNVQNGNLTSTGQAATVLSSQADFDKELAIREKAYRELQQLEQANINNQNVNRQKLHEQLVDAEKFRNLLLDNRKVVEAAAYDRLKEIAASGESSISQSLVKGLESRDSVNKAIAAKNDESRRDFLQTYDGIVLQIAKTDKLLATTLASSNDFKNIVDPYERLYKVAEKTGNSNILPDWFKRTGAAAAAASTQVQSLVSVFDGFSGDNLADKIDAGNKAIFDPAEKVLAAQEKYEQAKKTLLDAQGKTDKNTSKSALDKAQEAQQKLEQARDVTRANDDINDAKKKVADIKLEQADLVGKKKDALDEIAKLKREAKEKVSDKATAVKAAESALNEAKFSAKQASDAITTAENNLTDARSAEINATNDLRKSLDELEVVRRGVDDATFKSVQASEKIEVAQRAVRDANLGVVKSQNDLVNAQNDVVKKQLDVEKSTLAVTTAQFKLQESSIAAIQAQNDVVRAGVEVEDAQQKYVDSITAIKDAQLGVVKAQESVIEVYADQRRASDEVKSKTDDLASAQRNLNKVISETASNSRKAQDALTALRDAQLNVKSTVLDVAEAQKKLNDLRTKSATNTDASKAEDLNLEVRRAELDLQKARNSLKDARTSVSRRNEDILIVADDGVNSRRETAAQVVAAQKAVDDQRVKSAGFATKIAEALLGVEKAQNGVSSSNIASRKAALDIVDSQIKQQSSTLKLAEALQAIIEASFGVKEAQQGVVDANADLVNSQFGVVTAENDLVKAREAVTDATRGVRDANKDYEDSLLAIIDAHTAIKNAEDEVTQKRQALNSATLNITEKETALANARTALTLANDKVSLAEDAIAKAVREHNDAIVDYNDLLSKKLTEFPAYKAVLDEERKLKDDLSAAERDVNRAVEDRTILLGKQKIERDREIADNVKVVESAESVRLKILDVEKAQIALNQAKYYVKFKGGELSPEAYTALMIGENEKLKTAYVQNLGSVSGAWEEFYGTVLPDAVIKSAKEIQDKLYQNPIQVAIKGVVDVAGDAFIQLGGSIGSNINKNLTEWGLLGNGETKPKYLGGPVVPGQRYEVNEFNLTEHFMDRKGNVRPIAGGHQYGYFNEPGYVIPAAASSKQAPQYIDQSTHEYKFVSNTRDPENTAISFMEQNRRARLKDKSL